MAQPLSYPEPNPQAKPRRGGCLLIGCMVLLLLAAVPVAAVWALLRAAEHAPPEDPRHASLQHALPAGQGTVEMDVSMARVELVPAPADSPLRLEGDYDASMFRLDEAMRPEGDGWSYTVHLRGRGFSFFGLHARPLGDRLGMHIMENKLRLYLPAGHPIALRGKLAMGEADLALGGLAIQSVDLKMGAGQHRVSFAEPTTVPLDVLRLDGSMGEVTVLRAGNASPREIEIRHGMGNLTLDLSGAWKRDADVRLRLGMGDSKVHLPAPQEASTQVDEARLGMGDRDVHALGAPVPGVPLVHIRASGGMGDLRIE
jgi:hypothetical protein